MGFNRPRMMKNKSFKISIPSPCSENWENMTLTNSGRHCKNCNHEVIDFTGFNQKSLSQYFEIERKFTCGIFRNEQLSTFLDSMHQPQSIAKTVMLAASMSLIGANALAQAPAFSANPNDFKIGEVILAQGAVLIRGRIIHNEMAIPGLLVRVKSHSSVTATSDITGNFTLQFFAEGSEQVFIIQVIDSKTNAVLHEINYTSTDDFITIELPTMVFTKLNSNEVIEKTTIQFEKIETLAGIPVIYQEVRTDVITVRRHKPKRNIRNKKKP